MSKILKVFKQVVKKTSVLAIIGGTVMAGNFYAPQLHNNYLRDHVGSSVVKVMVNERGGGSGFSVKSASGKLFIATNKHVCDGAPSGYVNIVSDSGISSHKKIIYVDNKHDICLVEGDKRFSPLFIGGNQYLGEFHYIVGHPGLRPLTVSQGEYVGMHNVKLIDNSVFNRQDCKGDVIELNPLQQFMYGKEFVCLKSYRSIQSSAVAYGGNSGSPVVDKYGRVIGILFAGPSSQEHVSFIVPVTDLKRVLEKF